LPYLPEDYVHRIGRTGRAGNKGRAISFVSREEEQIVDKIQRLIGTKIKRISRPGYEVSNRSVLLKNIESQVRPNRANKVTETQIERVGRFKKGRLGGVVKKNKAAK
jgi:superfamily II DNA/RNA helicase